MKIDCCNLPNFFECLFYFLSGVFFLFLHREILGEWGVFQQEILQCCSTKTRVRGAIVFFYVFLFFRAYISWWNNERELYNGKWKKNRSYQREETRRKGCEIHIKKYIDEYSTMWPKFFDVKSHLYFFLFLFFSLQQFNEILFFYHFWSNFSIVQTCAAKKFKCDFKKVLATLCC